MLLRGGANSDEQQQKLRRGSRNRRKKILNLLDSTKDGRSFEVNHAEISASIHKINGSKKEDVKLQELRATEIAKAIREKEALLTTEARAATQGDLLRPVNDDPEDDEKCKQCVQHFDDDGDMMRCSGCEGCWHRDCTDAQACDDSDTVRAKRVRQDMAVRGW